MSGRAGPSERAALLCIGILAVMLGASTTALAQDASPAPTSDSSGATESPAVQAIAVTPEPSAAPFFAGFDEIAPLSPGSGQGSHPLLEWDRVDGADHYTVFLYTPSGDPYWSWTGSETRVHVGGEPQLREGALGPAVIEGMAWLVFAYAGDGVPIALSPTSPIEP